MSSQGIQFEVEYLGSAQADTDPAGDLASAAESLRDAAIKLNDALEEWAALTQVPAYLTAIEGQVDAVASDTAKLVSALRRQQLGGG